MVGRINFLTKMYLLMNYFSHMVAIKKHVALASDIIITLLKTF